MPTTLTPVREVANYVVILRAIHERGPTQTDALVELTRRGLWLTTVQRREAGLSDREGWGKPDYPGASVKIAYMVRGEEMGDVRIQHYGPNKYRVGSFLPGVSVCLPGDTPKTEPEVCAWFNEPNFADRAFDEHVGAAKRQGWTVFRETLR